MRPGEQWMEMPPLKWPLVLLRDEPKVAHIEKTAELAGLEPLSNELIRLPAKC